MKQLSKSESEVLELLKEGYNSEEIATKTGKALNTIKVFEGRIYKKTGLKGRVEILVNELRNLKKNVDI